MRQQPMTVTVRPAGCGRTVVAVAGEIDMVAAPSLVQVLDRVLAEQHPVDLEVDLSAVTFLDCRGLAAVMAARRHARDTGTRLTVHDPQPPVLSILRLTGTAALLGVDTQPLREMDASANPTA